MYRKTFIKINLDNLGNNVKNILKKYNNYDYYIGVVKGWAYGHGYYAINEMIENGINYLAVSCLEEALEIRKFNKNIPILCLEPISLEYINEILTNNITISIPNLDYFNELLSKKIEKNLKIHLKIDSGMHRLGFTKKEEVKQVYDAILKNKHLELEGIFSHFATIGISDKAWDNQLESFKEITSLIDLNKIKIVHLGRSLTFLVHPKIDFCNGIRIGLLMYGFNSTPKYSNSFLDKLRLIKINYLKNKYHISKTDLNNNLIVKSCLELYSEILQIKHIKIGDYVGYGTGYQAKENSVIATIGIGYTDGIARRNSNRDVIINNKRYPIIGEIGMNMLSVKIDDTVKITDPVLILGGDISIREVSYYIGNSTYETLAMLPTNLPRLYYKNNELIYKDND